MIKQIPEVNRGREADDLPQYIMQKKEFDQPKELLKALLARDGLSFCEYRPAEDIMILYDNDLQVKQMIPDYMDYLDHLSYIQPEERGRYKEFLQGKTKGELELHAKRDDLLTKQLMQVYPQNGQDPAERFFFIVRDITKKKDRESFLEDYAMKDSLTMLYNQFFGRELINEYLQNKDPYGSCGMIVIDIDYFKYANDTYGHLFGDQVLVAFANMLTRLFDEKDVIMRVGGDEFVVFFKDIGHGALVKKAMGLIKTVRELSFKDEAYSVTCSAGVCFLEENVSGYTYDHLFENADWALYKAKEIWKEPLCVLRQSAEIRAFGERNTAG